MESFLVGVTKLPRKCCSRKTPLLALCTTLDRQAFCSPPAIRFGVWALSTLRRRLRCTVRMPHGDPTMTTLVERADGRGWMRIDESGGRAAAGALDAFCARSSGAHCAWRSWPWVSVRRPSTWCRRRCSASSVTTRTSRPPTGHRCSTARSGQPHHRLAPAPAGTRALAGGLAAPRRRGRRGRPSRGSARSARPGTTGASGRYRGGRCARRRPARSALRQRQAFLLRGGPGCGGDGHGHALQ